MLAACAQAINTLNGRYIDRFSLHKPQGWAANSTHQMGVLGTFIGNYTPTQWEQHAISDEAYRLVLIAAETLLQTEPEFQSLVMNTTYALVRDLPLIRVCKACASHVPGLQFTMPVLCLLMLSLGCNTGSLTL